MNEILIAALVLFAIPLSFWGAARFRSIFLTYLFIFIPGYLLLFRELYFKIYGTSALFVDLPDTVKIIKEVMWLYVLACFVIWVYFTKRRITPSRELLVPMILFSGYLLFEALRGAAAIGIRGEILALRENLLYVPAALISVALIRTSADLQALSRRYAYLMLGVAAYAFAQMAFQMESVAYLMNTEHEARQYMYSSFFADYNVLGWFSGTVLGLILPQRKAFSRAWLYYCTIFLAIFWMIASQSRTAIISLIVIGGLWAFTSQMTRKKALALVLLSCVLAGAVLWLVAPDALASHRLATGGVTDVRFLVVWPSLLLRYWEHPIIGHGLGLFGTETLANDWVPDQPDEYAFADNYYLVLALTGGIVGLFLFLFLLYRLFKSLRRLRFQAADGTVQDFSSGLQLALAVTLIYCLVSNYPQSFPEGVHIWFLIGAAAALPTIKAESNAKLPDGNFLRSNRRFLSRSPGLVNPSCPAN